MNAGATDQSALQPDKMGIQRVRCLKSRRKFRSRTMETQIPSAVAVRAFTSLILSLEVDACSRPVGDTKQLADRRKSKRGLISLSLY